MTDLQRKITELELLTAQLEARLKVLEVYAPAPCRSRKIGNWPVEEAWAYLTSYPAPKMPVHPPPPGSAFPAEARMTARAWNVLRELGWTTPAELLAARDTFNLRTHIHAGRVVIGEIARLRASLKRGGT